MTNHHTQGERREHRSEHAGGHLTDAGRQQGNRQTHDAQQRAGEQHEGGRRTTQERAGQQPGVGQQSRWSEGGGHGHETAGQASEHARTTLQGSETIITPMTGEGGGAGADRGVEQYRYGGEARSTHGHRGESQRGQSGGGGQQSGGQQPTGGGQHTGGGGQHGGQQTTGGRQGGHQRGGNQGGGHQGSSHQRGGEDTAKLRRRYSHSTEQTQYGGNLDDRPSAVEQTQTRGRENQSRTEGRVEGGNQNSRRYGTPQGEQGRSTRQGRSGSREEVHSGQQQTHGETSFGGDKGGSERDRRYGSRHGHGSERRR